MYTNQDAAPTQTESLQACTHAPGAAELDSCRYLRALAMLRAWTERAEEAHRRDDCRRERLGELWVLQGQLSYALDHCPNHTALAHDAAAPPMETGYAAG